MLRSRHTIICLAAFAAAACSDALEQNTTSGQAIAVLDSGSATLTFVDASNFSTTTVSLEATPAALGVRAAVVLVTLGAADAVQLVTPAGARPGVALASGAQPGGVAVESDSVAWVAERGLDRVVRVHFDSGPTGDLTTGTAPVATIFAGEDLLYVLNSGSPATISWYRLGATPATGIIQLTGENARSATLGADGFVYVVTAGVLGQADGRLAIVDPVEQREVAVLNGLGESPGAAVYHPSGRLLIASLTEGILEVATAGRSVVRGPGMGIKPEGEGVAALAVDSRGRVYATAPGACSGPGVVYVLTAPPEYRELRDVAVGVCPTMAALVGPPAAP